MAAESSILPPRNPGQRRVSGKAGTVQLCKAAGIGMALKADGTARPRMPKDLRDTFASHVFTAGVQLGYVSRQLGHADVSVTARHYANWAGGDAYRNPLEVGQDEVLADLLSRLAAKSSESSHSAAQARKGEAPGTSTIPRN